MIFRNSYRIILIRGVQHLRGATPQYIFMGCNTSVYDLSQQVTTPPLPVPTTAPDSFIVGIGEHINIYHNSRTHSSGLLKCRHR
jgi:hypothetical protein